MRQVDDLSGSTCPIRVTSTCDYGMGPPRRTFYRKLFRRQQYRGLRREWTAYSGSGRWVCFTSQPRTVQEYKGQGSKVPAYLGFGPADGLSVEPRWDYVVSDSLGGAFPNKVYATLEIRACSVTVVQPLQG